MKQFKYLVVCIFLFQTPFALASQNLFTEQNFNRHKIDFPKGDLKQILHVKNLIDYMYEFDQKVRKTFINDRNNPELRRLVKEMDAFHTSKIKEILQEYGWINISIFGAEHDKKAWLLVQHADDEPFFQAGVLFILSTLLDKEETDKQNYAYLYDRVAAKFHKSGMLQRYGTQVNIKDTGEISLQPYEGSLKDVEERRHEMGMETLEEYLEKLKDVYK